jgi:carbon monoxide dehydrogenase subunit G
MARYVVHIRSPKAPAEAFDFMADLSNFALWDPGVVSARQITGDGHHLAAVYEVVVKAVRGTMPLEYEITEYEAPSRFVARAESARLVSLDTITVTPTEEGSVVTYDAELTLAGWLGIADPVLGLAFRRIGDRAAEGLLAALSGERVDDPR